jgi:NAD-dependent SIR2 family protein deacetylase
VSIETVYFFGAGASKSLFLGMPLARELTIDYLLGLNECPYQAWKNNHDRVKALASDPDLRKRPIEEILNGGLPRELTWPLVGLVSCALWKGRENALAEGLKNWLHRIRPKNCVLLTTNYDNLIERHLLDMRDEGSRGALMCLDYGVSKELCIEDTANYLWHGCESKDRVVLLKLHGSVGWSKCLSCGKYRLRTNYAFGAANTSQENIPIGESCPVCGGDPWPVLVAPARNKTYDDRLLVEIWDRAGQLLRRTRRLVFGGFSLQPVDLQVKTLLRSSVSDHLKEVLIVDKDAKSILPRFEEIYGHMVRVGAADWREFIARDY